MAPTLHRLLWGLTPKSDLRSWSLRPWELPAVGLPARVAVFLYLGAQASEPPPDWTPSQGPLTWHLAGDQELLSTGRCHQFGFADENAAPPDRPASTSTEGLSVVRTTAWELPPHEAYFLPFVTASDQHLIEPHAYALYCDVLALLTALDGGEAILDRLVRRGLGVVPFEDRWTWRSRINLPMEAWRGLELVLRWSMAPYQALAATKSTLNEALARLRPRKLALDDFLAERIDIRVADGTDAEIVRTVPYSDAEDEALPADLLLQADDLKKDLMVRIGQITAWPRKAKVASDFPAVDSATAQRILEQIASAFYSPNLASSRQTPELVLLPELSVPTPEVRTVRELVARTGIASLAGLYWRVLPPVYGEQPPATGTTWFVNEAELAIPVGHRDRGPTDLRWYRVRKPLPTHLEVGLARQLSKKDKRNWSLLEGRQTYRFLHARWGDFTVAVCSDLLGLF